MKLILTSPVDGLGSEGDIVDVADGYGRNYLLPRNLAVKATGGALKHALAVKVNREESLRKGREEAEAIAKQLVGTRVVIAAQAGDEGKLFGSIGTSDVIEGVQRFAGVALERKAVSLEKPIKSIGLHEVPIKLHPDVEFTLTLDVIPA
ncbi:MAG: 50S ribosomal protein L9 [Acidimicrobiia bacterium]|nr:50S ribosomal protein L9 [Acidimicrobiia bacterium]